MNYRIWVAIIIVILFCGALRLPVVNDIAMRRCGPPMSITMTNKETGEKKNYFVIPVWYEYSVKLGYSVDNGSKAMRGFHFELEDGTVAGN